MTQYYNLGNGNMRKHLSYLIAAVCILSMSQVSAADPATMFPASANMAGYNAGAYNTTGMENEKNYRVDKGYVQSIDDVTKDEQIYDATVEENQAREGVLYNPHFLLEKINFEGNTKISDSELEKLALEVLGEDV